MADERLPGHGEPINQLQLRRGVLQVEKDEA